MTPNLDGLIQKGTYFTNAYSSVDGTIISLNTIFNEDFQIGNAARYQKVSLKQNNLIDVLKKNGYRVYGSLPNFASFNTLLQQFENKTDEKIKGKKLSAKTLIRIQQFGMFILMSLFFLIILKDLGFL